MEIGFAVLSGFVLAAVAPLLHRAARGATGWLLAILPLGIFVHLASRLPAVARGEAVLERTPWVPGLDVALSFHLDGLSLLFALLISGVGALILAYSGAYLAGHPHLGRFYGFLLLFMASMLGLVLADGVVALFVFWELTSLSSYLLIGFLHDEPRSRAAALQALLVTGGGGLALLAGLVLLATVGDAWELSGLLGAGGEVRAHALYTPILLLVLLGAFTKSAQFPFHFWLPNAMEAPTPVSAYLHSATMVKAGVYLLARLSPVLGGTDLWVLLVTTAGAATMLVGAYLALKQSDMKRVLAYSTVSALGTLTLLLGLGSAVAVVAAMVFLLAHALYKGALFMVAGAVDHETGTRDVDAVGGLRRAMPITATAAILAALSLAGLAPLLSFIGKELLFEAVLVAPAARPLLLAVSTLGSMILVAVAGVVGIRPFFGPLKRTPREPHEAPLALWLGPVLLAVTGVVAGVFPRTVEGTLVAPAAAAVLGFREPVHLALWHGLSPALLLSAVALLGGLALYKGWIDVHRITSPLDPVLRRFGPAEGYERALRGLMVVARAQSRFLQNGYLRYYLLTLLAATLLAVGGALLWLHGLPAIGPTWRDVRPYEGAIALVIVLAALMVTRVNSRLGAVAALGVVGYGLAILFVLFGAPDLAMTQFLFETLTVLLFVLVFYHVPRFTRLSPPTARVRDAVVSVAFGLLVTLLVLAATTTQLHTSISGFFGESSRTLAHGRNVVNVILVDFRALDTLGEITVLAVAAIGVYALLKATRGGEAA